MSAITSTSPQFLPLSESISQNFTERKWTVLALGGLSMSTAIAAIAVGAAVLTTNPAGWAIALVTVLALAAIASGISTGKILTKPILVTSPPLSGWQKVQAAAHHVKQWVVQNKMKTALGLAAVAGIAYYAMQGHPTHKPEIEKSWLSSKLLFLAVPALIGGAFWGYRMRASANSANLQVNRGSSLSAPSAFDGLSLQEAMALGLYNANGTLKDFRVNAENQSSSSISDSPPSDALNDEILDDDGLESIFQRAHDARKRMSVENDIDSADFSNLEFNPPISQVRPAAQSSSSSSPSLLTSVTTFASSLFNETPPIKASGRRPPGACINYGHCNCCI